MAATKKPETVKTPAAKKAATVRKTTRKVKLVALVAPKAVKAPAAKKAVVTKSRAARPASPRVVVSGEQRAHYVEVAAFYIAERRGFAAGNPTDDWLAAEAEVDRLIATGQFAQ